ncbi:MAG: DUF4177 domain-containing protein [Aggregatilineales bacterium]
MDQFVIVLPTYTGIAHGHVPGLHMKGKMLMQKWEYLSLQVVVDQLKGTSVLHFINGNKTDLNDRDFLTNFLNDLGEQGWELISETLIETQGKSGLAWNLRATMMRFKRPKP